MSKVKFTVCLLAAAALLSQTAQAGVYYWDTDGDSSSATGGSGNWDLASSLWRDGSSTGTLGTWPSAGTTNGTYFGGTAGTVSLTTATSVNNITFNTDAYTVQGNTLTLNGTAPTVTTDNGVTATIGSILAGGSLTKAGAGTLILSGANTYSSGTKVNAGTLQLASTGSLHQNGNLTINPTTSGIGATLDLNGRQQSVTWAGLTFGGAGAVTDAPMSITTGAAGKLTLTGTKITYNPTNNPMGATISGNIYWSGTREFDVGHSTGSGDADLTIAAVMSGNSLLKTGDGILVLTGANTNSSSFLCGGTLKLAGGDNRLNTAYDVYVVPTVTGHTATFDLNNQNQTIGILSLGGTNVNVPNGGAAAGADMIVNTGTGTLTSTSYVKYAGTGASGAQLNGATINGKFAMAGNSSSLYSWQVGDSTAAVDDLTVNAVISGSAQLVKSTSGRMVLTAANTYTGNTIISQGTLALSGAGSLVSHDIIEDGGTFDVSGVTGGFTLASGQKLSGDGGTIHGGVTVASGATLSPGTSGVPIGTLTFDSPLILDGVTLMDIAKSSSLLTCDEVIGTTLTAGGTLTVSATGIALALGDTWDLFSATTFAGGFSNLTLPTLSSDLAWDTSRLTVDGTITVSSVPEPSVLILLGTGGIGLLAYAWRKRK